LAEINMTQTNTDYLFQVTAPPTDRSFAATGASDGAARFDDHLSQASTHSGDDSRNLGSGSPRTDTNRYDRDDRSWNRGASKPSRNDRANSNPPQSSPSNQEDSRDRVHDSASPNDNADRDKHKTDKSDDTTAADSAGASQATKDNSPKTDAKPESNANTNAPTTVKPAADNKADNKKATATDDTTTGATDGQAIDDLPLPGAVTQHADETAKLAANVAATDKTNEDATETQVADSEAKQSKAVKAEVVAAKSNQAFSSKNNTGVDNGQLVDKTEAGETASVAAKTTSETAEASATLASTTTTKSKSNADESSDPDSRTGLKSDAPSSTGSGAPTVANKVDAAQLVGSIPSITDAAENTTTKSKDSDQGVKPIAAKGEPVAAAFARMTRNNVTSSSDSASGANDLPQIDPSRFIGRVAKAFQTAQDRGGTLQLRLSPPELGALRIELNVKDGVMSASLQTENANARRLLLDHLPALRDRLAEQNIRVDRFDVDVRQEGSGGQTDTRGSQQQQFQHQPDQPTPRRQAQPQARTPQPVVPERTVTTPSVSDTGLNLIV
jgi:flagellar hook-length control protein FliK